ncbi:downstream target of AGL15-4 [Tasmannia lanceolata]|uniref:downstream target of AGL15-4 n=1 Tax=Tasmannia lanceolata TaxID=3420 RepID=UPI00406423F8
MATSPHNFQNNPPEFRAPPPSPAGGRRSTVINDDVLAEFLEHSLHVPDLILPDRIFPREISAVNPLEIDFESLITLDHDSVSKVLESIAGIGCFQLVNHGISSDLIGSVKASAAGIFRIAPEKREIISRSNERRYGFEEFSSEEEEEMSGEFFWCRDDEEEGLKSAMEGIWPLGYSNFRSKTESLWTEIEKVATKVLQTLLENTEKNSRIETSVTLEGEEVVTPVLCFYNHGRNISGGECVSSLKSYVIRMLIRRSDYSHSLCLHICDGASEFYVYSKKGWISFSPTKETIVVTVGDQIEVWSGGLYKHVIGRPVFNMEVHDSISMAFLYSPSTLTQTSSSRGNNKTISLTQQVIIAIFLSIIYHFLVFFYKKF